MKENIKSLIMKRATSDEIQRVAIENGMVTMADDGLKKMLNGVTTFEELIRVMHE